MKIFLQSFMAIPQISEAITILTDKSKVNIENIHYDEKNQTVTICFHRYQIMKFKKSLFGKIRPIYSQNSISSLIKIKQVEDIKVYFDNRLVTDFNSCFTMLFGIKIEENRLYIGSAEEIQGHILCHIDIKIKEIDLMFRDLE